MKPAKVESINDRAIQNIRYIRDTMERAGSFTAVPGLGVILMGGTALLTSWIARLTLTRESWFLVWLTEAIVASGIGLWTMVEKAHRMQPLSYGPGRKFAISLLPALIAGAVVTIAFYRSNLFDLMPGMWLLFYGIAVITGGAYSVRVVPVMGMSFMLLGGIGLFLPQLGDVLLGAGFGALHVIFGSIIVKKYGG